MTFDGLPGLVELDDLAGTDAAKLVAPPAGRFDQAFGLEPEQGVANRGAGHGERLGQLVHHQSITRGDPTLEDSLDDGVVDLVGQRRTGGVERRHIDHGPARSGCVTSPCFGRPRFRRPQFRRHSRGGSGAVGRRAAARQRRCAGSEPCRHRW